MLGGRDRPWELPGHHARKHLQPTPQKFSNSPNTEEHHQESWAKEPQQMEKVIVNYETWNEEEEEEQSGR